MEAALCIIRVFSGIPGLCQLDAGSILPTQALTNKNTSRHCQLSLRGRNANFSKSRHFLRFGHCLHNFCHGVCFSLTLHVLCPSESHFPISDPCLTQSLGCLASTPFSASLCLLPSVLPPGCRPCFLCLSSPLPLTVCHPSLILSCTSFQRAIPFFFSST